MITDKDVERINIAKKISEESDDPNTKVGCVIVSADGNSAVVGFNHFMKGVNKTQDRLEKPNKYSFMVHAEESAIIEAVRAGDRFNPYKSTAYITWLPCASCFRLLVNSGVVRIVGINRGRTNFEEDFKAVSLMAKDLGIKIDIYDESKDSKEPAKD